MAKIIFIFGVFVFFPVLVSASIASDFTVNPQSTYPIPYGAGKILILDLTLPEPAEGQTYQLESVSLHQAGTADHTVISKLEIWQDGSSAGWDQDETEAARVLQLPFFDTPISGSFKAYSKNDPWRRIFVTLDLQSGFIDQKIIQLQLLKNSAVFTTSTALGPIDAAVTGLERTIRHDASIPAVPLSPLAKIPEVISTSAIRWHFIDLANNEFGFKILDGNLKEVARKEESNLSYLDETGLQPSTEYSGRRVAAFNDRGESLGSSLALFPAASTLALPIVPFVQTTTTVEEVATTTQQTTPAEEPVVVSPVDELKTQIQELQLKLIELLNQLIQLLQTQIALLGITLY